MDPNKIADWVQITATIGVLIGIVLVVIELRQAKAIAHADITANFFSETAQNNRVQMGENPAVVLAKACLRPSEVTAEELFVLEGFFGSRWSLADRTTHRLELVGELPEDDFRLGYRLGRMFWFSLNLVVGSYRFF